MSAGSRHGRAAVVTGGARGIGYAITERLLGDGARVAIWDIDGAKITQSAALLDAGERVHGVTVDITDPAAAEAAAAETADRFGAIDILVNNAGIAGPSKKLWDYTPAEWGQVVELDLNAIFYCCRAVVPLMLPRGWGRIVNIASIAGKEGNPNASAYSAAKAGAIGLTKSLGKELADTGILVNCVTPAAARTEIFDQISEEHIQYMLSKIPMGRFALVEEIAAMVAWLASDECAFSTAGVFDISGGRATY